MCEICLHVQVSFELENKTFVYVSSYKLYETRYG